MGNGTLISFEGPEGAGKSSILEAVLPLLEEKGIPYITTREPGGVDIAEKIRQVILDPDHTIDSSVAYQGYGRGLSVEDIEWLNQFATDGLKPDLTLYFDLDVEEGLARIAKNQEREVNRLDLEGLELHQKVRQGYLALYEKEPERIVKIDASQSFEAVFADVLAVLENRLGILK